MNRVIAVSWAVLIGAALIVFISKGLFTPVAYHLNVTGEHDYAPAWFSMTITPIVYGAMLYIINRYEKREQRAKIGVIIGSFVISLSQILLAWTALSTD